MDQVKKTFFDEIGGMTTIQKVHKIFYDKIYAHPWIGQFFETIDQTIIERQQNDFMGQSFGGAVHYLGKIPVNAHKHMFITEELFELRKSLLIESLKEAGITSEQMERWLKVDGAFKAGIVKKDVSQCEKRYFTDSLEIFENPEETKRSKAS